MDWEELCTRRHMTQSSNKVPHPSLLKTSSSPAQWLNRIHVLQHITPAPNDGWLIP